MNDDAFYDEVARELQAKQMIPGLWTKAYAEAGGEVEKARALYIRLRVEQLSEARNAELAEERRTAAVAAGQRAWGRFRRLYFGAFAILTGTLAVMFGIVGVVAVFSSSDRLDEGFPMLLLSGICAVLARSSFKGTEEND